MTLKHFLLGLGLHNITGQKLSVRIVSNLGHCIDYKSVCQIQTAEAEVASMLCEEGTSPGLKPQTEDDKVLTYFWADNFNKKIDSEKGTIMINSTHLIKFQESSDSVYQDTSKTVSRDITKFAPPQRQESGDIFIDSKKEPTKPFTGDENNASTEVFDIRYFLWKVLRYLQANKRSFPTFSGWQVLVRKVQISMELKKTVVTYLPPIDASVKRIYNNCTISVIYAEAVSGS